MKKQIPYKIFIYSALACEAKAIIDFFGLKKDISIQPFAVYVHNGMCLTVTGVGKTAIAAAVAYTQALIATVEFPVLLNIGIAGHRDYPLGQLFLIDRIIDADSKKNHYPSLVCKPPCSTATIQTASTPQMSYNHSNLCDMEASAFYETATRFSTSELIHCFKVISDNQTSPANTIQPKLVVELISAHLLTIETFLGKIVELSTIISPTLENRLFDDLIQKYHFTASQKMQLKTRLSRWKVLTDNQDLPIYKAEVQDAKNLLVWLDKQINNLAVIL